MQFKIKHLVISTVTGSFKKFEGGAITEGDDFNNAKVNFTMDVKSIDTNQAMRDAHLQSGEFFDAEKYPEINFQSTSFTKEGSDYKMVGNLTMKGVTVEITKCFTLNSTSECIGSIAHFVEFVIIFFFNLFMVQNYIHLLPKV